MFLAGLFAIAGYFHLIFLKDMITSYFVIMALAHLERLSLQFHTKTSYEDHKMNLMAMKLS